MRGRYIDPESRAHVRLEWANQIVPGFMREEVAPLLMLLSKSDNLVALDVGANKGYWAKAFLNYFANSVCRVHLFEPSPENYKELIMVEDSLMFAPEDHARLDVHNVAVGAEAGEAILYTNEDGSPLASLYKHELDGEAVGFGHIALDTALPTQVISVDGFLSEHAIAEVDVLKIDVEGHEFAVLEGASESLRSGRINCLLWEFGMHQVQSRHFFKDYYELLSGFGYEIFAIRNGIAERVYRYSHEYENFTSDFEFAARFGQAPASKLLSEFEEADYLDLHGDVRAAVREGVLHSGLQHWLHYGRSEGRALRRG